MLRYFVICFVFVLCACVGDQKQMKEGAKGNKQQELDSLERYAEDRLMIYKEVELTTDMEGWSEKQKKLLALLIEAAKEMDPLFWHQAYGEKRGLMQEIDHMATRRFSEINYGPWDRLNDMKPFVEGVGNKPLGANFYPEDMNREELENADLEDKLDLYTLVRRDEDGALYTIPYHEQYKERLESAASKLEDAAELAENNSLRKYLLLRAEALRTDEFKESDLAWLDIENNTFDIIIGPIENYEDRLFNAKTAYEAYVLVKDKEWSKKLEKYVPFLSDLQKKLPVEEQYKQEEPGRDAQLNAYDAVYYSGDCNAGSKTIAVNLPNDENIQQQKGTKRSQLKNTMRAKFDEILLPIAGVLIDEEQINHINFNAFFSNVMFHEVAHGLGIKNTISGDQTVREALQEQHSPLEEAKADVLGLFMVTQLVEMGELEGDLKSFYTTFMAGILRSVRFGASSAHGKANMLSFNYFREKGAFEKVDGRYRVDYDKFRTAMNDLGGLILRMQGNGDREKVVKVMDQYGQIHGELQRDLARLEEESIPVDIVFKQGKEVLGLSPEM